MAATVPRRTHRRSTRWGGAPDPTQVRRAHLNRPVAIPRCRHATHLAAGPGAASGDPSGTVNGDQGGQPTASTDNIDGAVVPRAEHARVRLLAEEHHNKHVVAPLEVDRLHAALDKHGTHTSLCGARVRGCGLEAAQRRN